MEAHNAVGIRRPDGGILFQCAQCPDYARTIYPDGDSIVDGNDANIMHSGMFMPDGGLKLTNLNVCTVKPDVRRN